MDIDFSKTLQRGRLNCGWLEREHIEGDKTMIVLKICEKLMPRREQEEIYLKHSRVGGGVDTKYSEKFEFLIS